MDSKLVWGEIVAGSIIFLLANLLAIIYKYDKFYVLLVIGITLLLKGVYRLISKRELINTLNFFEISLFFVVFGLIGDLIMGIWITHLWTYPGYKLLNYMILYLIAYPFGGFTMIYSFAILELLFEKKPRERQIDYIHALNLTKAFVILGAAGMIASFFITFYPGFFMYLFFSVFIYGLITYIDLRISRDDLLERLLIQFTKLALLILFVSYAQGLIQEYPNVHGREWIYQSIPFNNVLFLGIPVLVLFGGWIFLLMMPFAVYELFLHLNKKKAGKSFFWHR